MKYNKKVLAFGLSLAMLVTAMSGTVVAGQQEKKDDQTSEAKYIDVKSEGKNVRFRTNSNLSKAIERGIKAKAASYSTCTNASADEINNLIVAGAIPASYMTSMDKLTSKYPDTRDQNPYGTCWAFAATATAEFGMISEGYEDKSVDYSELQLAYFTYNSAVDPLNGTDGDRNKLLDNARDNFLDYGGWTDSALKTFSKWSAAASESVIPYDKAGEVAKKGLKRTYAYDYNEAVLEDGYAIDIRKNQKAIKAGIMKYGIAVINFGYHYGAEFGEMEYENSVHNPYGEQEEWGDVVTYYAPVDHGVNHAVTIVGWDDNFSRKNFSKGSKGYRPEHNGAWLVRNSWSDRSYNSIYSYFWMSYDEPSIDSTAYVMNFGPAKNYVSNYQYDGCETVEKAGEKTTANVFTAREDLDKPEILDSVQLGFMNDVDIDYTVKVYTKLTDATNPESGTLIETKKGITSYSGLYNIKLDKGYILTPGEKFAVVVSTFNGKIDVEKTNKYSDLEHIASKKAGQSFFKSGIEWCDANEYSPSTGNYCIKAFTSVGKTEIASIENTQKGVKVTTTKGADEYIFYKWNGTDYECVATTESFSWIDKSAKNGEKCKYKVAAKHGDTIVSDMSLAKSITYLSQAKLSSVKNSAKKTITVKWKKNSKASGYQIQYATNKKFTKGLKTVKITKNSIVSKKITKLAKGKTYYVRVRAYRGSSYGMWSVYKTVKIKK